MCPQCGKGVWHEREGWECELCGYRYIAVKDIPQEVDLVYCTKCATHYLGGCTTHSKADATPFKFPVVVPKEDQE